MKNYIGLFALLICFSLINIGCHKPTGCSTNDSLFRQLFSNVKNSNPNYVDIITMDTKIHAYTFTVSSQKEVCFIGYQSYSGLDQIHYKIVIMDSVNNSTIYSNNHLFSSGQVSYISPSQVITFLPGKEYTINRVQNNNVSLAELTGRLLHNNNLSLPFPFINGDLTITGSNFYDNTTSGNLQSYGIPYIELIFKQP